MGYFEGKRVLTASAKEQVVEILKEEILDQTLKPGQQLNLDLIAKELGISRTPLKDALNTLQVEGLVVVKPRVGTFVSQLNEKDLIDTYEIRIALELAAGRKLVETITPDGLRQLEDARDKIDELGRSQERDRGEHLARNLAFHELFVKLTGNSRMLEIYRNLNTFIQIYRIQFSPKSNWTKRIIKEREEHERILEALHAKDARMVEAAVLSHLTRGLESLKEDIRLLSSNGGEKSQDK